MLGALSRSITSAPSTVVGVDAAKPGRAARELVTTTSSTMGAPRDPPPGLPVDAEPTASSANTRVIPASKSQVNANLSDLIKAPLSSVFGECGLRVQLSV